MCPDQAMRAIRLYRRAADVAPILMACIPYICHCVSLAPHPDQSDLTGGETPSTLTQTFDPEATQHGLVAAPCQPAPAHAAEVRPEDGQQHADASDEMCGWRGRQGHREEEQTAGSS